MQGDEDLEFITMDGEQVSLADLAGIDLEGVAELRSFSFPIGMFIWEISAEPEPPKIMKVGEKGAVPFSLVCKNVLTLKEGQKDFAGKPDDLIGKIHRETFFFTNLRDLGYVKAFLIDIGMPAQKGKLPLLLPQSVGWKFAAPIIHIPNKDNKDAPPYVNLNRRKIIPASQLKTAA